MRTTTTLTADDAGCYVDGWYGHYTTAYALLEALELGWPAADDQDRKQVEAVALTKISTGHLGVSLDDANDARRDAGLPVLSEDDEVGYDVDEYLGWALDDAEAWLNDHVAPEDHWFGHHPDIGGWGLWPEDDDELMGR